MSQKKTVIMEAEDVYFLSLLLGAFATKTAHGKPFTKVDASNCREVSDTLKKMLRRQLTQTEFSEIAAAVGSHVLELEEIGSTLSLLRGE
jgi:hypothetical protein